MGESNINKYPLTGFSKIEYEEFLGILHMLSLYSSLTKEQRHIIDLIMDGMKYRENKKNDT